MRPFSSQAAVNDIRRLANIVYVKMCDINYLSAFDFYCRWQLVKLLNFKINPLLYDSDSQKIINVNISRSSVIKDQKENGWTEKSVVFD